MKKEIVYIAGKITNDPDFQSKFEVAKTKFENLGCVVLNPAELPPGMNPGDYMRICLPMIETSNTVYFMKSYKDSPGAQIEYLYSNYIGKKVMFE